MTDYVKKYNDYSVGILILGYAKRYVGSSIMMNEDVCSICIKFISFPYSLSLEYEVYPHWIHDVMDKIHMILAYKTTNPQDRNYNNPNVSLTNIKIDVITQFKIYADIEITKS